MLEITKDNVLDYLKEHIEAFDQNGDVRISAVGEGTQAEDGDGYVNFIYRVQTDQASYVVKQGRPYGRATGFPMAVYRIHLEYDAMRILHAICPEYVPEVYLYDDENCTIVMEDVSRLKVARFELAAKKMFPSLGRQIGEYIGKTSFYTSEYYLPREKFRELQCRFMNSQMRRIMEEGIFVDRFESPTDVAYGPEFEGFMDSLGSDTRYETERFKLRRKYMSHADCLIHADLHPSNILASEKEAKVIDMEFCFMGPFGYDLGYLIGNLISQYSAACYKTFDSEEERKRFKAYILATIRQLYVTFEESFLECWIAEVKEEYRNQQGLLQSILEETMVDLPGYASVVNWFRATSQIAYPEFDVITDIDARKKAVGLSLMIGWELMFSRYRYRTIDDLIQAVLDVEKIYESKIR